MGTVLLCSKPFPRTQKHWRIRHCFPGSQGFSKVQHCLFLLPATKEYKLMYYVNSQIICSRVVFMSSDDWWKKEEKKEGGKKRYMIKARANDDSTLGFYKKRPNYSQSKEMQTERQTKPSVTAPHVLSSPCNLWGHSDHIFSASQRELPEVCLAHSFWCKNCIRMLQWIFPSASSSRIRKRT